MFIQHSFCFFVLLGLDHARRLVRGHFTLLAGSIRLFGCPILLRIIARF